MRTSGKKATFSQGVEDYQGQIKNKSGELSLYEELQRLRPGAGFKAELTDAISIGQSILQGKEGAGRGRDVRVRGCDVVPATVRAQPARIGLIRWAAFSLPGG